MKCSEEKGEGKIRILKPFAICMKILIAPLLLISCSSNQSPINYKEVALGETDKKLDQAAVKRQPVSVKPVTRDSAPPSSSDYVLGPGDELTVNVNGEEFMQALRLSVDGSGFIQLPIVNRISVLGLNVAEIQENLVSAYSGEFIAPWVVVSISKYRSRPIYMLGEFLSPGVIHMERLRALTDC